MDGLFYEECMLTPKESFKDKRSAKKSPCSKATICGLELRASDLGFVGWIEEFDFMGGRVRR
jgi:hypothetical protein